MANPSEGPSFRQVVGSPSAPSPTLPAAVAQAKERLSVLDTELRAIADATSAEFKTKFDELLAAKVHLEQVEEAAAAAAVAAAQIAAQAAAAAQTPPVEIPLEGDRNTHRAIRALQGDVAFLKTSLEGLSGGSSSAARFSGAPKFAGLRSDSTCTVDTWLLHFEDWFEMQNVASTLRVKYAILCLEGKSVRDWYNLKRQLLANGKQVDDWDTFCTAFRGLYAEIAPDVNVRNRLLNLSQGSGSVQAYHNAFRAILSQAVDHPVTGADAVWFFKHGLSERIRLAIAVHGDTDLDLIVHHAKAVDAAMQTSCSVHAVAGVTAKGGNKGNSKSAAVVSGNPKRALSFDNGNPSQGAGKKVKFEFPADFKSEQDRRIANGNCTKCNVPKVQHQGPMGANCPHAFVPAK